MCGRKLVDPRDRRISERAGRPARGRRGASARVARALGERGACACRAGGCTVCIRVSSRSCLRGCHTQGARDGRDLGLPAGHAGHASRRIGAVRAALGAVARGSTSPRRARGPPARRHPCRTSGTTLTAADAHGHRRHPVHDRSHARCWTSPRTRRAREVERALDRRRAGAHPRHARDRRRALARRRPAWREALARRARRAHRRQHADARRSRGGVPRDRAAPSSSRPTRPTCGSRSRTATARRPTSSGARSGLIVEADGRDAHTVRKAFNADRRRDARLMLLGWRVVRFTWQQVTFEPAYVAATLRGLLN